MKRLFIILLCLLCLTTPVCAHPGDTDENGGHIDHTTGEYHYHHGYPAHDHYDIDGDGILDCPHYFDDISDSSVNHPSDSSDNQDHGCTSFIDLLFGILDAILISVALGLASSYVLSMILFPFVGEDAGCSVSIIIWFIVSIITFGYRIAVLC